jgi:hypothetical protein
VTAQHVCVPGYAKKVRAVPARLKRQAYAEYGIFETEEKEVILGVLHVAKRYR